MRSSKRRASAVVHVCEGHCAPQERTSSGSACGTADAGPCGPIGIRLPLALRLCPAVRCAQGHGLRFAAGPRVRKLFPAARCAHWENFAPGPCTPRPSYRPKSPLPEGNNKGRQLTTVLSHFPCTSQSRPRWSEIATVKHPHWQCLRCGTVMFWFGATSHKNRCMVGGEPWR